MFQFPPRRRRSSALVAGAAVACALSYSAPLSAQSEGGLYIAGAGFSFQTAANRGIEQNPGGRQFFLLSLPPETRALLASATGTLVATRKRVVAAHGVLLVCQRDIDNGKLNAARLASGVVAVRGWPPAGSTALPDGQRHFAGEDPTHLPAANEALRTLRSTCS